MSVLKTPATTIVMLDEGIGIEGEYYDVISKRAIFEHGKKFMDVSQLSSVKKTYKDLQFGFSAKNFIIILILIAPLFFFFSLFRGLVWSLDCPRVFGWFLYGVFSWVWVWELSGYLLLTTLLFFGLVWGLGLGFSWGFGLEFKKGLVVLLVMGLVFGLGLGLLGCFAWWAYHKLTKTCIIINDSVCISLKGTNKEEVATFISKANAHITLKGKA